MVVEALHDGDIALTLGLGDIGADVGGGDLLRLLEERGEVAEAGVGLGELRAGGVDGVVVGLLAI